MCVMCVVCVVYTEFPFVANNVVADDAYLVRNFSIGKWVKFPDS